jgi:hypothetical protein
MAGWVRSEVCVHVAHMGQMINTNFCLENLKITWLAGDVGGGIMDREETGREGGGGGLVSSGVG